MGKTIYSGECELKTRTAYQQGCFFQIISGMGVGVDTLAIRYADERELTKILFPANWKSYHRIAGILRNEDMLSVATHLVVFEDGESNDTCHMIEIAKAKGIPIWSLKYHTAAAEQQICLERLSYS